MIRSLKILLANDSVSDCFYDNNINNSYLMPIDILQQNIDFALKKDYKITVLYPERQLPEDYVKILSNVEHKKILPYSLTHSKNDIIVFDSFDSLKTFELCSGCKYILRICKQELFKKWEDLPYDKNCHLKIIIKDIPTFTEEDYRTYHMVINNIVERLSTKQYGENMLIVENILDRIFLSEMNNCGAGETSLTLAPNGQIYVCPSFYYENLESVGTFKEGIQIKNPQLYTIKYAPICKHCEAYHCKRCIWLNKKLTLEVNTPSKQQCVISHLERNGSRLLLLKLQDRGYFKEKYIKDIYYLDPFDTRKDW